MMTNSRGVHCGIGKNIVNEYVGMRMCIANIIVVMVRRRSLVLLLWIFAAILTGCSTTASLPEDEVLYTGIQDISYGKKQKKTKTKVETGVITAINDAYNTVSDILSGQGVTSHVDDNSLTKEERDSIKAFNEIESEARSLIEEEVDAVLSISPNNSLLGSSRYRFPLPVGLWVYNRYVGSKSRFGKWMFNTFAATPKLISSVNPGLRAKIARNVLHNYGYFQGAVSYEVLPQKNPKKAKVQYNVSPSRLYRLDNIEYQNFSSVADSIIRANMWGTLLHRNDAFTASKLSAERDRLNTIFRNNGYYYYQSSFFTYRADTLQRPYYVQLQVRPSVEVTPMVNRQYHLRDTRIHLIDNTRTREMNDTIGRRSVKLIYDGAGEKHKPSVRYGIMRRYVFYRKGDLYKQSIVDLVQNQMSNLGIFSQVFMNFTPADTVAGNDSLDVDIYATLEKRYDAEFKADGVSKSNGMIGPGLSFGLTRRNAFHGAEALKWKIYGNYEWQTGANQEGRSSLLNSYEYGTSLSLDYPYIKLGKLGQRLGRRAITSTSYKLEADWMNRAGYFGRVSFGARVMINYQRRKTIKHEFTPFRLDYDLQLHSTEAYDSLIASNQALAVSMRNQFVPSMQYVLNMTSRDDARNPRRFTLTVKEAGNVTSGIYSCLGKGWNEKDKHLFGVPFAQFVKVTAEFTEKMKVFGTKTYLVGRVLCGTVYSFGNATIAPYNDMLTIGGANSLRAFAIRSIGPGSYRPENSRYSYVDQIGDFKLEANLEYRFPLIGSLNGAVFVDCGNVWLLHNNSSHPGSTFSFRNLGKELALGTGLGVRYDLDFIVVRFDVGVGIHAPYDTGKSGYYNMTRFGKSLGYHLAIGYPF